MTVDTQYFMTGASADEVWPLIRDFHYSRRMPSAIIHSFAYREAGGLFGDTGSVVACCVYGAPVNRSWPPESLELKRLVRNDKFTKPLSKFVSWSLRWLKANTEVPFVLSYADSGQGHHGGIYQATGFSYVRTSKGDSAFMDSMGNYIHGKTVFNRYGTRSSEKILKLNPTWSVVRDSDKYLYVRPLRQKKKSLLKKFGWQELPYPKPDYASRPLDEPLPCGVSQVQPLGDAPNSNVDTQTETRQD